EVALADARKALSMFRLESINVPVLGIVENMAYFTPEELPNNKYYLFGKGGGKRLAEEYEVPFLGEVPIVQSICESGDSGLPSVINEATPYIVVEAFNQIASELARIISMKAIGKEITIV
ncbi:MAG: Mrp/NBP35 family ATP-binding protein, partial [Chitinophagales bacterium]|nr:Mrp/NBP35 family ATP-binding protein [Chitinophagales bacterium]